MPTGEAESFPGSAHKILIVSDEKTLNKILAWIFRESDYEIFVAARGDEAMEIFLREKPFLVLTDAEDPASSGLLLLNRVKAVSPETIVVLMSGRGFREWSALDEKGEGEQRRLAEEIAENLDLRIHLGNDPISIRPAAELLADLIGPFFSDEDKASVKLGLLEVIRNAIEHGSLEIDYTTKTVALETNTLRQLIDSRKSDPRFADRDVTVEMKLEKDGCRFVVTDKGPGFDWKNWIDELGRVNVLASHGRGILMTRFYFDNIAYNEQGNQVTLVKRYPLK